MAPRGDTGDGGGAPGLLGGVAAPPLRAASTAASSAEDQPLGSWSMLQGASSSAAAPAGASSSDDDARRASTSSAVGQSQPLRSERQQPSMRGLRPESLSPSAAGESAPLLRAGRRLGSQGAAVPGATRGAASSNGAAPWLARGEPESHRATLRKDTRYCGATQDTKIPLPGTGSGVTWKNNSLSPRKLPFAVETPPLHPKCPDRTRKLLLLAKVSFFVFSETNRVNSPDLRICLRMALARAMRHTEGMR